MFEHLHPSVGKSEPDEFYINASTQDEYNKGSYIFNSLVKKNFDKKTKEKLIKRFNLSLIHLRNISPLTF